LIKINAPSAPSLTSPDGAADPPSRAELLIDEQLGIAHDVDKQDVGDLETKMKFKLRGH
jgi:hypothetical protein